jgi:hypothetical protein
VHFGFIGDQSLLYVSQEDKGRQGGDEWKIYGGHRLWLAPEEMPKSYSPDNHPISYSFDKHVLKLVQPEEKETGMSKEIEIRLSPQKNQLEILHRLINQNQHSVRVAAWAITAMAPGGKAIIPQEPYGEGNDYLLPARCLALWSFTRMNDPRWIWGNKFIQAKHDPVYESEQKIGILNKQRWTAYCIENQLLIKIFEFDPAARYTDFNSNNEIYINGKFLEVETLGPLVDIPPLGKTEHTEYWMLNKDIIENTEESIEQVVMPHVADLVKQYGLTF